jgi:hypothetical protein
MKVLITIPLEASERGCHHLKLPAHIMCVIKKLSPLPVDALRSNQPRPKVNYFTAKIIDFIALMKASKQTEWICTQRAAVV